MDRNGKMKSLLDASARYFYHFVLRDFLIVSLILCLSILGFSFRFGFHCVHQNEVDWLRLTDKIYISKKYTVIVQTCFKNSERFRFR